MMNTSSSSNVDLTLSVGSAISSSSLYSICSLNHALSSLVGRNSNRASDFSSFIHILAVSEIRIRHSRSRIKTMNWSRLTIFQRYFIPRPKTRLRIRLPMENVAMELSRFSFSYSIAICSVIDLCDGTTILSSMSPSRFTKSFLSMKKLLPMKLMASWSGSPKLYASDVGCLNAI